MIMNASVLWRYVEPLLDLDQLESIRIGTKSLSYWPHRFVTESDAVEDMPCGPDPRPVIEAVETFVDAGYDHLYFHQIGADQDGFLRFWSEQLEPVLRG